MKRRKNQTQKGSTRNQVTKGDISNEVSIFSTTALLLGIHTINGSLALLRRMLRLANEERKLYVVPKIPLLKAGAARKGFLDRSKFEELLGPPLRLGGNAAQKIKESHETGKPWH